ncbi:MAG: ribosomal protein S18-alanine N-acetyltransferase [Intestinibacillus sp.]
MSIVPMEERHISALAALEKSCFTAPWSEAALREELHNPCALFLVAEDADGTVRGYIGCQAVLDEGYIANVAVSPACRRQGAGRRLLSALLAHAKERELAFLTLEVRVSNVPAIHLYRQAGFCPVGTRKDYYSEPREDALLMTYYIDGA